MSRGLAGAIIIGVAIGSLTGFALVANQDRSVKRHPFAAIAKKWRNLQQQNRADPVTVEPATVKTGKTTEQSQQVEEGDVTVTNGKAALEGLNRMEHKKEVQRMLKAVPKSRAKAEKARQAAEAERKAQWAAEKAKQNPLRLAHTSTSPSMPVKGRPSVITRVAIQDERDNSRRTIVQLRKAAVREREDRKNKQKEKSEADQEGREK